MILATNDDGLQAEGLQTLIGVLNLRGTGHFVASNRDGSSSVGTALALPGADPVLVEMSEQRWVFRGATPGLLVSAACTATRVGSTLQGVLVGVNEGPNVGRMTLHSGTVGAALTAFSLDLAAIAISLDDVYSTHGVEDGPRFFELAAQLGAAALDEVLRSGRIVAINLNVPNLERSRVLGIRVADLASTRPPVQIDRDGMIHHQPTITGPVDLQSDVALLRSGYATVTMLAGEMEPTELRALVESVESQFGLAATERR